MKIQKTLKVLTLSLIASGFAATSFAADVPNDNDIYMCGIPDSASSSTPGFIRQSQITVANCKSVGGQLLYLIKKATPAQLEIAKKEQEKLQAKGQTPTSGSGTPVKVVVTQGAKTQSEKTLYCVGMYGTAVQQVSSNDVSDLRAFETSCVSAHGKLSATKPVVAQKQQSFIKTTGTQTTVNTTAQQITNCRNQLIWCGKHIGESGYPATKAGCKDNYEACVDPNYSEKYAARQAAAAKTAHDAQCLAAHKSCLNPPGITISAEGTGACMNAYNKCMVAK